MPASGILVNYSFDDDQLDTGPDTFRIFENVRGTVLLSSAFRFSGYHSLEIHDVAGDKHFPELQGYFALRKHGMIFAHFALMTADPAETLNLALAGPGTFFLKENGIAFWLKTSEGFLYHVSDSIPKKLFAIKGFTWYVFDVAYDIDKGTYDLLIHEEGQSTLVISLREQQNAANFPGSTVNIFSFIGDTGEDSSNVLYYVDDIVIGTDKTIIQLPFVAPGRRKLFIDYWNAAQQALAKKPCCLPVYDWSDLGIPAGEASELADQVQQALQGGSVADVPRAGLSKESLQLLEGVRLWHAGCAALSEGKAVAALQRFELASSAVPQAKLYRLSALQALIVLKRWENIDELRNDLSADWGGDPRFEVVAAMIGVARGNLDAAEEWLARPAQDAMESAGDYSMITQEYYFVLLWKSQYLEAEQFASRMVEKVRTLQIPASAWLERAGDAAFYRNDPLRALQYYEESLKENPNSVSAMLKLSDVHYRLGNLDQERLYREKIYGTLQK